MMISEDLVGQQTAAPSMEGSHAMPTPGLSAAKKLCELSDWSLTNLQIQKILYIAHMMHIGSHGLERPLLRNTFEAWDLGPVIPAVYHKIKIFGAERVGNIFRRVEDVTDSDALTALDETFEATRGKSASQLVAFTHYENGAWARNYQPNTRGLIIPNEDIESEYRERFCKTKA